MRGKFLQALMQAEQSGALPRDPAQTERQRHQRLATLRRHDWGVYAKMPMTGPTAVLDYLSRYTHRTAVGKDCWGSRVMRCACACAPTTQAANVWCRSPGTSSLADCCNTCCLVGSSTHPPLRTAGTCHQRRAPEQGGPERCCRCHSRNTRPWKKHRLSCAAWPRRRSIPAHIAASAACGWCSCWRLSTAQCPRHTVELPVGGHHECGWAAPEDSSMATAPWSWGVLRALGENPCSDTGRAWEPARPWAVQGETEHSNVMVTTHREPAAAFAIARIGG